jgi:hypothetical protein
MIRKTTMFGALFATTQQAAVAAPLATGTASCPITSGSGTVNPGLSTTGVPGGLKINFKAVLGHPGSTALCGGTVTTPAGVKVRGGTITGTGYFTVPSPSVHGSSCVKFDGTDTVGTIKETIAWVTIGGPIANTTITYSNNVGSVTGPANGYDTIKLVAPVATKAGSFAAGTPRTTKLVTTLPAPRAHCVGTTTAFKITGGGVAV